MIEFIYLVYQYINGATVVPISTVFLLTIVDGVLLALVRKGSE